MLTTSTGQQLLAHPPPRKDPPQDPSRGAQHQRDTSDRWSYLMSAPLRLAVLVAVLTVLGASGRTLAGPVDERWAGKEGPVELRKDSGPPESPRHSEAALRAKRAATARLDRLWDEAVIPYEIDPMFKDERAALFRSAMRHWENHTCIKFVERSPDEHRNYIVFTERSCGCCSFVGKRGNGAQAISIGNHCDKFGIVVHELGHVVGFWHEHTRPDRDQHVQIIGKNIMSGQEYNFNKLTKDEVNSLGLAYDYDSILHYATNTFAKDTYLDTILPLHGHLNTEIASPPPAQQATPSTQLLMNHTSASSIPVAPGSHISTGVESSTNANLSSNTTRAQTSGNSTGPTMINDVPKTQAFYEQLERDFQSMLQFQPGKSATFKRSIPDGPKTILLDGSVVVHVAGDASSQSTQRPTKTKRESVDMDDGYHMLSMDNMLAKTRPEIGQRVRLSVGDIAQTNLLYKCPKCGKTILQPSGSFHTPDYYSNANIDKRAKTSTEMESGASENSQRPVPQNDKSFCEWRLSVGSGERIMFNFTDLDLAPPVALQPSQNPSGSRFGFPRTVLSDHSAQEHVNNLPLGYTGHQDPMVMLNCVSDYVEIRDGYTYRAPLIAKLCGHISGLRDVIKPIVSTSNRLLVSFRSSNVGYRGFLAQHEAICGGLILLGNALYEYPIASQGPSLTPLPKGQRVRTEKPIIESANPTTTVHTNRINANGTSSSENEVLLSSQTNLRLNHLQSQQPVSSNSSDISTESLRNSSTDILTPTQAKTHEPSRAFGWDQWPAINASVIQSPNWPEHYRPSRECIWRVMADENHQISMRFDAFDLEPHDSCAYDYVEIREGDSLDGDLIGRYCGSRVPDQILSSSRSMIVKFVSDSDMNRGGFFATLQPEIDECKLGTHGCSYKCSNSAVPYRCECPDGLELASDGKSCIPTCGGTRNESTGQISSPSFPDLYPASTKCVWEIIAPLHHKITLNFTHFDLEGNKAQECEYDFVDIRSRLEDGRYVKNGVFCGPNQALVVTSIANVMRIEFKSDNSIQKSGFMSNYFVDKDECTTDNGGCRHICTNTIGSYLCSCNNGFILHENKHDCIEGHCMYTITSPEGKFHSPNFPNLYQPNKECAWVFSTAPGHRIKLIFDQFDIENHQECAYDHVAVFDGEGIEDPALGRFCGSRRPLTLVSSFNMLYLLFRSDATNERRGFNGNHTTVCGGRLQANLNQIDHIYSHPNFDRVSHYKLNEECEWLIEANYNQKVRIEFTFFQLEADNNCNFDQILVYDGTDDTATQVARLCGTDISPNQARLTSSGESMLIIFRSDESVSNKGFSLIYSAIETSEDEPAAITNPSVTKYTQSS